MRDLVGLMCLLTCLAINGFVSAQVCACVFDIGGTLLLRHYEQDKCTSPGPSEAIAMCVSHGFAVAISTVEPREFAMTRVPDLLKLGMPNATINNEHLFRTGHENVNLTEQLRLKVLSMHDVSAYVGSSANCTLLFDDDEDNRAAVVAAGFNAQVGQPSSCIQYFTRAAQTRAAVCCRARSQTRVHAIF